jgi:hypothetical protein
MLPKKIFRFNSSVQARQIAEQLPGSVLTDNYLICKPFDWRAFDLARRLADLNTEIYRVVSDDSGAFECNKPIGTISDIVFEFTTSALPKTTNFEVFPLRVDFMLPTEHSQLLRFREPKVNARLHKQGSGFISSEFILIPNYRVSNLLLHLRSNLEIKG